METVTLENIKHLAEKLQVEEQLILVEKLVQNLRRRVHVNQATRKPQNLYGVWRTSVSDDFDIDTALSEIRGEHKAEFEGNS